jgi:hypothetical protein
MNARRAGLVLVSLGVLTGGVVAARAAAVPAAPAHLVAPSQPVITVHDDTVPARPAAAASSNPTAVSASEPTPADAGIPAGLPAYTPARAADSCESQAIPHPTGFASMGGTGTDTITQPNGSTATYPAWRRHAALQYVCLGPAAGGGVEVQAILMAVGADDPSTYTFAMGPAGVTLVNLDPGRAATRADFLAVGQRLDSWPTGGCSRVSIPDLGPRHAVIDDTFCFSANGALRHVDLHERATGTDGVRRDLAVSLDLIPGG